MMLKGINIRPFRVTDKAQFDQFRRAYWDGDLEIPKGYGSAGVESAIAEDQHGRPIASLTGTMSVVLDPLIRNPHIKSGPELVASIYLLERTLAYQGQRLGAVDAFIAIPDHLVDYHRIVEKAGYVRTVENCVVYRRPLLPDTEPLIGPEMEAQRQIVLANLNRVDDAPSLDMSSDPAKVM